MAERYRHSRPGGKRKALGELRTGANTTRAPANQQAKFNMPASKSSSPRELLRKDSPEAAESVVIRTSHPSSPAHKRVSQIASEHDRESKRNSAVSTTSTTASRRTRKTYIGPWQLGRTIGKGGCSRVRVVRHRYKDLEGAVKIITRSTAESTRAQSLANLIESSRSSLSITTTGCRSIPHGLEREIAIMKLLEHPNIVRLYDVWENRNELYLIMEYINGGELFHYVDSRKGLPEDETVYIFRQIVSALLYCHRMLICHRDLKPENILLDRETMTVKLIDFGMAALQPHGRLLSTPCGSPHYAAPEVISSRPYDGMQADVWSCGVILYVMLTGMTPYNYSADGDIRALFRDIARAHYWMPPDLSPGAKALIQRIFQPNPQKRVTMDQVWESQLVHKYDEMFGFVGLAGSKEAAIGPIPTIEHWKLQRPQDIDREILRNMRTLWHSQTEGGLVQKLLNNEQNQEKLFYAALIKHKEEQYENYAGHGDDMEYSASDYHHSQPPQTRHTPPPLPKASRTQSQYSIMNDEHLRRTHSLVEPPPSVSSYDPYRASKNPIINSRGEYVNVTVHRNGSARARKASMHRSLRHPNGLRIEMLKNGSRSVSKGSSSSLARSNRSRASVQHSSASTNSMTSSAWPSSPPIIATIRPSDSHKRGVSFTHLRRTSTASALASQTSTKITPTTPTPHVLEQKNRYVKKLRAMETSQPASSPTIQAAQALRSRKERAPPAEVPKIKVRRAETPNQQMRSEIRKHSAELEKACEEAFFRSSVGSSITANTSTTGKRSMLDTPPSSISAVGQGSSPLPLPSKPARHPLPELSDETTTTYLTKTLEETREKLAAYKPIANDGNTAKFDEVMRLLDTIMPVAHTTPSPAADKRSLTVPDARTPEQLGGFLPIITEESDNQRSSRDGPNWQRVVTSPSPKLRQPDNQTIRAVAPSSPGTIAPLNVRKRSSGIGASDETGQRIPAQRPHDHLTRQRTIQHIGGLTAIDQDSTIPPTPQLIRKKRTAWLKLSREREGTEDYAMSGALAPKEERNVLRKEKALPDAPPPSQGSGEVATRKKRLGAGKGGIGKWLGRNTVDKGMETVEDTTALTGNTTNLTHTRTTHSLESRFSSASPAPSSHDGPPESAGAGRSWFARFFNIKPAVKVLCFSIARGRARQELVILFREWQRHGIRDLQYSRETNTITARVDRQNALDIKPVTFRVEMFVVLEHGRKAGLSIGRFVLVKGAASGFRKVIEVVDGVMRSRGWMVEDEEKCKALCEIVGG